MATKILDDRIEVTLTSGYTVLVKAINLKILERFDLEHNAPEPPMREAEVIGGHKELVPDEEDPDFQASVMEYNRRSMQDLLNMLVIFGVDVELPLDDSWIDDLAMVGIAVLEDSVNRMKVDYVQMILMDDMLEDLKKLMSNVFLLSGVDEEVIQQWMTMF